MNSFRKLFFIAALCLSYSAVAEAKKSTKTCEDMQLLSTVAEETIQYAMDSDTEDEVSDYLVLSGDDPVLESQNVNGQDLWTVPVVVDGEGCYGNVEITVEAGTCKIVGDPSFTGVSCTDE